MALGGGTFITQNKKLPGAYINFVSAKAASVTLSDRGYVALGVETSWGPENEVFTVTSEDFIKNTRKIFGYDYTAAEMKGLRDLFLNAHTLYAYRLNGGGTKAANAFATAKYGGVRGNDIKIVISANVDDATKFDVATLLGTVKVDEQIGVADASALVANDFVTFKSDATLAVTAGTALTGGTDKTVTGEEHQAFLNAIESYSFNAIGYVGDDATTKSLYAAFTERLRDSVGKKFQAVLYNKAADYEGVVNVKNTVSDAGANAASMVFWTLGVIGGTAVNRSASNKKYDGEFTPVTSYTQSQLEAAIDAGEFTFHQVDQDVRVLTDINSLVTTTEQKGEDFKSNQTIRVLDQIAIDIANIFNTRYLGKIQNNDAGRISLWTDIVKHHNQLNDLGAIEGFDKEALTVAQGESKKSVVVTDAVTVVNAMEQLYMTVLVS